MKHSTRKLKRQRVDDSSAPNPWTADSDVWFDDGNLIIVAGEVAFRVYKGTLARTSEVFQHLLDIPTPALPANTTDPGMIDGVPVVHVADSAVDLKNLLLVLFCNKNYYYHHGKRSTPDFSLLSALISLGDKYNIPSVMEEAIARVKRYYSTTLADWGKVSRRAAIKTRPEDAMTVVRIARITGHAKLLAPAFLICTSLGSKLIEKMNQPDGLSPDDVMRVMEGKVALSRRCNSHDLVLRDWTRSCPLMCIDDCRAHLRKLLLAPFFVDFVDALARDNLKSWEKKSSAVRLCKACRTRFQAEIGWHCQKIWDYVPAAFGLASAPSEFPARRPARTRSGQAQHRQEYDTTDESSSSDSETSESSSEDSSSDSD